MDKTPDAIILLGGGTGKNLEPVLYTKERLEFLAQKVKDKNTPVIVSGGFSVWLKNKPKYTEADVMAHFLKQHGFLRVFKEGKSRDTVGNAYLSKKIVRLHGWKNVTVVSTDGHIPRVRWIFKKVFGNGYRFSFMKVPTSIAAFSSNPGRREYEHYITNMYKKIAGSCADGNDAAIMRQLKQFHPLYSSSAEAKKLEQEIQDTKQRLLGYKKLG